MTMLVHTSPYIIQHERMAKLIKQWIESNLVELTSDFGEFQNKMEQVLKEETDQVPLEYDGIYSLADLRPHLKSTLDALEFAIEKRRKL